MQLNGHELSRIGLGTNRLTNTAENRDFLRSAVEAGINFIDTAHLYTGGESELTIGAALAPFADDLAVATKGGYHGGGTAALLGELEQSLEHLGEPIALYYVHRLDPEASVEETVGALAERRDAGQIDEIGLSEVTVDEIERARKVAPIAAVQSNYSLAERKHEAVIDYCEREEILFVPFFPLRGEPAALAEIASRHGASATQIKLAWLLQRSPVVAPIPGTLSVEHVRENLGALDIELSEEDLAALER